MIVYNGNYPKRNKRIDNAEVEYLIQPKPINCAAINITTDIRINIPAVKNPYLVIN